jgi:hypothetical protein
MSEGQKLRTSVKHAGGVPAISEVIGWYIAVEKSGKRPAGQGRRTGNSPCQVIQRSCGKGHLSPNVFLKSD